MYVFHWIKQTKFNIVQFLTGQECQSNGTEYVPGGRKKKKPTTAAKNPEDDDEYVDLSDDEIVIEDDDEDDLADLYPSESFK